MSTVNSRSQRLIRTAGYEAIRTRQPSVRLREDLETIRGTVTAYKLFNYI